jgi:uncharacterized protein (TIGR02996 family)
MPDLRNALESALVDHPGDLATHMAYADHLAEQGDPHGEFIRVQLQLEDETLPPEQRRKLRARETQLRKKHEREWLGGLAAYLLDGYAGDLGDYYDFKGEQKFAHRWQRGWLARVEAHWLTRRFAQALAIAPAARLLRELCVTYDLEPSQEANLPASRFRTPAGSFSYPAVELLGAPWLANLRLLRVGKDWEAEDGDNTCRCCMEGLNELIRHMPRLEELYLYEKCTSTRSLFGLKNLTNLRALVVDHRDSYPMKTLAKNPALANLTHLGFHPHFYRNLEHGEGSLIRGYLPLSSLQTLLDSPHIRKLTHLRWRLSSAGDDGIRLLIDSGWLGRLKVLDLRHGRVTDEGARLLAACLAVKRLDLLDLTGNQLTSDGISLLRGTGVPIRCADQQAVGSADYLTEGDFE